MSPDEVARSYDQIAHRWDGDGFPRDNGMPQHERAVAFTPLRGRALDIGCGSSGRLIDLLLGHGFRPEGLDLSARMLHLARRRHPHLTFHHADIRTWPLPCGYDFISAWDSIWHVPLADQEAVLWKMLRGLNPGGVAIFSLGGTTGRSEITNTYMGPPMYHSSPGVPRALQVVAEAGAVCRHLEYDQYPELHAYVIAQREE